MHASLARQGHMRQRGKKAFKIQKWMPPTQLITHSRAEDARLCYTLLTVAVVSYQELFLSDKG